MNLFQEILPGIRNILSNASAFQIQALLNLMSEEGVISKEYHQTLLHEKDREDLARKICLTLVGKQDVCLESFASHSCLQFCGNNQEGASEAKSARTRSLGHTTMGSGILPAKGYLDLLHSDVDPLLLYRNIEDDLPAGHTPDTSIYDPDNNPDLFYTVESGESGEEVCLCSSTGEAYEKIAELAEYLLKDQLEEPVEDLFGRFVDAATEGCSEPKTQAYPPGQCSRSTSTATFPLDMSTAEAICLPNFHVQFSVTTITPAGRLPKIFNPSDSALHTKGIQMILAFLPPSPQVNLPFGPTVSDINSCLAEDAIDDGSQIPPLHSDKVHKRPELVDNFSIGLKTSFGDKCKFVSTERDIPMEHLYIEGNVVQHHAENRSGRNADLRVCDLEEKEKTTVKRLFEIVEKNEVGANKVIVILGKAGMGKSLLVQKICLDWSKGRFARFEFVFRFDCWRLSLLQGKHYSLRQLLFEFSVDPQEGEDQVYRYLLRNPEKVLLIFDGFEELQDLEGFSPCSDSPTRKEAWGIGAVLAGLFQKKKLNGCVMLLTSRPKDKLHQYLPKVDKILEVVGFSSQQAEAYLARYFEGASYCTDAVELIKSSPYLFSHCYNPDLCRIICFVCKSAFESGDRELPSNLTGLLVKFLLQKLECTMDEETSPKLQSILILAQVAWSLGQGQPNTPMSHQFPPLEARKLALQCGIMVPLASSEGREECSYAFSSFVVHNFLAALHLVFNKEIKDKKLTKHLWVLSKPKRFLCSWDLVPRFLAGLLFIQDDLRSSFLFREEGEVDTEQMIAKKQKSLSKYIRKLEISNLSPDKLLEIFHCVQETEDPFLLQHLALRVRPALSFLGFPFTPPDVHILHSVLRKATKEFALDLRRSSVGSEGLRHLVCLKNVTSYRASLGEAVQLWECLWGTTAGEQLQSAIKKFIINPFKAQTVMDVDDLSALVRVQEKMSPSKAGSSDCNVHVIPAVTNLRHLEFALGPTCGLKGFKKLVDILDAFPALQHLDLDSQKENRIGDEGVAALSDVLPHLRSLETLNLSQNKITNLGAEKLAKALPSLPSLRTLSLYNNSIGDTGAENFARILPGLTSLRVLNVQCNKITAAGAQCLTDSLRKCPHVQSVALWNPTIPHGVLEHLQHLDSRIRSL
ncbi:MHC class II transactivator [Eublepharis macularius]|uniref:MHC class II transactivator n=1 Tax=Eublepharis macularius TaxID=481883 RepID=A0AA97K672_EUBMA|nr:MHC class II transactivator [Eublepharis macularius]